jgi:hypothetical protein
MNGNVGGSVQGLGMGGEGGFGRHILKDMVFTMTCPAPVPLDKSKKSKHFSSLLFFALYHSDYALGYRA